MKNITSFCNYITTHSKGNVSIDACHNMLLFGLTLSLKPKNVLELGVGDGYCTRALIDALEYNGQGTLTSVDNWHDTKGKEPGFVKHLRRRGVKIVAPISEKEFVEQAKEDTYDLIVSDADHNRSGLWCEKVFKMAKDGAFLFFHDIYYGNKPNGPIKYLQYVQENNIPHYCFSESSRKEELCKNGWLMVINRK